MATTFFDEYDFSDHDMSALKTAKGLLDNPGITAHITNLIGAPIEKGFEMLPKNWREGVGQATQTALLKAIKAAVYTMDEKAHGEESSNIWHKIAVAASGGIGGFFGLASLPIELPVSTTIMLRSIADVARSEGETITDISAQLSCLEVFALGGNNSSDDASESGYYAVRAALAKAVNEAAQYIAEKGVIEEAAPAILRLITLIASQFGIQVSEKLAAQAVPVVGAAGGAIINTMFMDHFQDMARGHFIVRRLERKYGPDQVENMYRTI